MLGYALMWVCWWFGVVRTLSLGSCQTSLDLQEGAGAKVVLMPSNRHAREVARGREL
jgi:hypothetical protein